MQIRQISKIAAYLIAGILLPSQTSAQVGKPNITSAGDTWVISYTVTVKGTGTVLPELGSDDPVVTWTVNRTYTGSSELRYSDHVRIRRHNTK